MTTLTETLSEMVSVAEQYCKLIEGLADESDQWLASLYQLMPRLHSAVTLLNAYDTGDLQVASVDLDERFELTLQSSTSTCCMVFNSWPRPGRIVLHRPGNPAIACTGGNTWWMPSGTCMH